jgi:hypothetical protein
MSNTLENRQNIVIEAIKPIIQPILPELPKFEPIIGVRARGNYFKNPIQVAKHPLTAKNIPNNYANRTRVNRAINILNEKSLIRTEENKLIRKTNKFENRIVNIVNRGFKNVLKVDIELQNITSIEQLFDTLKNIYYKTGGLNGMENFFTNSIILHYVDNLENETSRTLNIDIFDTFSNNDLEEFTNEINKTTSSSGEGSDYIGEAYNIDFSKITIHYKTNFLAGDSDKYIIYDILNVNSEINTEINSELSHSNKMKYYNIDIIIF